MTTRPPARTRTPLYSLLTSRLEPVLAYVPIPLWALKRTLRRDNAREAQDGWDRLRSDDESGRYWVVRGALHEHAPGGSVLDIGCAAGLLLEGLDCPDYLGIDAIPAALGGADLVAPRGARFIVADAQTYQPQQRFDAIVFNECLYYLDDPVGVVRRLSASLEPGGVLVVSCYDRAWATRRLLRDVAKLAPVAADFTVGSATGKRWRVVVLRPTTIEGATSQDGHRASPAARNGRRAVGRF